MNIDKKFAFEVLTPFLQTWFRQIVFGQIGIGWFMVIVNKEEKEELLKTYFIKNMINFYEDDTEYSRGKFKRKVIPLNKEYSLMYFYLEEEYHNFKRRTMLEPLKALKTVFSDKKGKEYEEYKKLVLDLFGAYGIYTILLQTLYILNVPNIFTDRSLKESLKNWSIFSKDIKILDNIIKQWKENFKRKLNLFLDLFLGLEKESIFKTKDEDLKIYLFTKYHDEYYDLHWDCDLVLDYYHKKWLDVPSYLPNYKYKSELLKLVDKSITIIKDFLYEDFIKTNKVFERQGGSWWHNMNDLFFIQKNIQVLDSNLKNIILK